MKRRKSGVLTSITGCVQIVTTDEVAFKEDRMILVYMRIARLRYISIYYTVSAHN